MDNLRKNSADCIIFDEQAEYCHRVSSMNRGLNLKYYIETLGCQMNEADSEQISGMLIQMGYSQISDILSADLIVFNTCCVRENAEFKLYGHIGELKAIKQTNKELIIVICGCMMQ